MPDQAEGDDVAREPLPKFDFIKTGERAHIVSQTLLGALQSGVFTRDAALTVAPRVHKLLKLKAGTKAAVSDSLLPYCGPDAGPLVVNRMWLAAVQLVCRLNELKLGPVAPFWRPTHDQWVPLEVQQVKLTTWLADKPGAELRLLALGGQPAGHVLTRKFPSAFLRFLAYKVGFTRKTRYDDNELHFTGLRFWLHLNRVTDDSPQLDFDAWDVSAWMLKHNKRVIALRTRFDFEEGPLCPQGYTEPCWGCKEGAAVCPASVNR